MQSYRFPPPDQTIQTEDYDIGNFKVKTYVPGAQENTGPSQNPLVVYFHGGGWVMGSVQQEDGFCRQLCGRGQLTVVSVDYRLAPEFKFPAALEDGVTAVTWALARFQQSKAVLMGTSAGGNLAFSTALRLASRGLGHTIKGIVALAPVTVHPDAVPAGMKEHYSAYEENTDKTINTGPAMLSWFDAYGARPDDDLLSILLNPGLKHLGKVYMTESGADTLRDDARLLKQELESASVPVMYDAYPGYPHYSWLFPSPYLAEHQKVFFKQLVGGIRWVCD